MQHGINVSCQLSKSKLQSILQNPLLTNDEKKKINKILSTLVKEGNKFILNESYKCKTFNGKPYGRYYNAILPLLWNPIKSELFSDNYLDIDIVNCHAAILLNICKNANIPCKEIENYVNNRSVCFDKLLITDVMIDTYNKKYQSTFTINDIKKTIYTSISYGSGYESIGNKILFTDIETTRKILLPLDNYKKEIYTVANLVIKLPEYSNLIFDVNKQLIENNQLLTENKKKKIFSQKLLAYIIQNTERILIDDILDVCKDHDIIFVSINYDGLTILKTDKADLFLEIINKNDAKIKFISKPWKTKLSLLPITESEEEIILSDIQKEIQVNIMQSNTMSIAKCLLKHFGKNYKSTKQLNKDAIIYKFEGHYWKNITTSEFRTIYSTDLLIPINEYLNTDSDNKEFQKIHKLVNSTVIINQILFEVIVLLNDEKFESIRDSNINLVAFKNGILSLTNKEFRNGKKEDNITNCISHNYISGLYPTEFIDMLSKIIPNELERNFLLKSVSKCFKGKNLHQRVYIFNGKGSNGKSLLMEIFKRVFDIYFRSSPAQLLTDENDVADKATPTICKMKGKRFLAFMEPSKKKLNSSMIKKLSGETTIESRNLFSDSVDQRIEFTMFISANEISYDCDYSMLRRLLQINFNSTFDEKIISDDPVNHTYVLDNTLIEKSINWTESIISFLIDIYDETDSDIPDSILAYNLEQNKLKQTDIQQFLSETYWYDQNKYPIVYTTIKSIQDQLIGWKIDNSVTKIYKKNEVKQAVLDQWKNTKLTSHGFNNLIKMSFVNPQSAESEFPESEPISDRNLLG